MLRHTGLMANDTAPGPLVEHTALITGGGSGIGLACAKALIADGAAVVLAARNVERLAASADELRTEFAGWLSSRLLGC